MSIHARLRDLARNLYWTWHPDVAEIFRDLDPPLWREVNHNPVEFLSRIPTETLEEKAVELALEARISQGFHQMQNYLEAEDTWGLWHTGPLRTTPVAYFSAEFGLHESLPIYSGGLGILAGDHLKAASDLDVPLVGVGLFYALGYFNQRLDSKGWQQEDYFATSVDNLPMERVTDPEGGQLRVKVQTRDAEIVAGVWSADVGRSRLILLDTDVEGNSDECRRLTAQLYGGDERTRIRQELVLGVGGRRALEAMNVSPGVIHLNEGHSAFAILELARSVMERDGRPFADVEEHVAADCVFTTHTPVEAGHDRFSPELVEETLGPLREQLGLAHQALMALGRVNPEDEGEPFCMTVLGLKMSRWRNGVSARHGGVSRAMWHDLWPDAEQSDVPIGHVTNGIHVGSWLGTPMARLYRRYLGPDWQKKMHELDTWAAVDEIDEAEFWEQHQILKTHLIDYVEQRVEGQRDRGVDGATKDDPPLALDPGLLTIGFARRFAPYKRADLLIRDPDRLDRIVNDPERPVRFIYAGMAHPEDEQGKQLIRRILEFSRDPRFAGKIVFVEGYDVDVCRHFVQGVDVWLNTPRRPLEACGTSGQKAVLNGGLNLSTLDGWWAEGYDGSNGFAIGQGAEHADDERQDRDDAQSLYETLEQEVIPLFYQRDERGLPREWIKRQKHAIRSLGRKITAQRMVVDYTENCYLPAAGGVLCQFPEGAPPKR